MKRTRDEKQQEVSAMGKFTEWKQKAPDRLLRLRQVLERVPISKSSWWSGIKTGRYPSGRKLSERTTVWLESEIMAVVKGTWEQTQPDSGGK